MNTIPFDRNLFLQRLREGIEWDIVILGGGATGLGTALDATSRGYKTLLLEKGDFARGTWCEISCSGKC
jgi:glycerol-3-phosphate dehydrogenase